MRKTSQGFTIIEVMIVVTIISVLASIVMPFIRVNTIRVKMSEAILAFGTCRNMVTEMYQAGGDIPDEGAWGCEITKDASRYVDSVQTKDPGKIVVSLRGFNDGRIDFNDLTLMPLDNTGNPPSGNGAPIRRWRCGAAADGTNVPPQYLPTSCRGN